MDDLEMVLPQAGPSKTSPKEDKPSLDALKTLDPQAFNVEAFEGTYKGRALITRYLHMTKVLTSRPSLARLAYLHLYPKIKNGTLDHQLYLSIMSQLNNIVSQPESNGMEVDAGGGIVGEAMGVPDMEWVEETMEVERKEVARLDVELRGYMSNLIKESIRLTYLASAELAAKCGNCYNANKNYASSREYSTSPQHHLDLGLGILETALAFNQPGSLPGQIPKLESYLDRLHPPPGPSVSRPGAPDAAMTAGDVRENREREARGQATRRKIGVKLRVAKGVVALNNRDYEKAGRELGAVGEEGGLEEWEGEAISTADVCLITALCVLATGSRNQIRTTLLDRPSFRIGMDDSQGWLLDLIRAFMDAQYGQVSSTLAKVEPHILLNPFLYPHTTTLIHLIRTRSIVQYIEPFSSIRIDTMATAFDMSVPQVLETMEGLIKDDKIKGKIDLIDMVLVVPTPNVRDQLYDRAIKVGTETLPRTHGALIRMKLAAAGINVDPRPQDGKSNGDWDAYPAPGFRMGPTDSNDHIDVDGALDTDMQGFQDGDFVETTSSDGEVVD